LAAISLLTVQSADRRFLFTNCVHKIKIRSDSVDPNMFYTRETDMKIKVLLVTLLMMALTGAVFAGVMPSAEELGVIDAMIDKMMAGYNASDATAFYADWATMMAAICTPQAFQTLYVDNYMKTFGAYASRTVNADETVVMPDVPNGLVVYTAKFANNENVKMSVNLMKEDNVWKIQQLTIQAMP